MSSYIKEGVLGLYVKASLAFAQAGVRFQRFVGGVILKNLEDAVARHKAVASTLARRNRELQQALDARNVRGLNAALIVGRTRYGDIISDTALTYNEVYLPDHDVSIKVSEEEFQVIRGSKQVRHESITDSGVLYLRKL